MAGKMWERAERDRRSVVAAKTPAARPPEQPAVAALLALQRSAGNAAVAGLVDPARQSANPHGIAPAVQRKWEAPKHEQTRAEAEWDQLIDGLRWYREKDNLLFRVEAATTQPQADFDEGEWHSADYWTRQGYVMPKEAYESTSVLPETLLDYQEQVTFRFEHDPDYLRKDVTEAAQKAGLKGLCHAWTIDWLLLVARRDPKAFQRYAPDDLARLATKQAQYYEKKNLMAYADTQRSEFELESVGEDIVIESGLGPSRKLRFDGFPKSLGPGTGYYLSFDTRMISATEGHAIALYVDHDGQVWGMDQNQGLFSGSSLTPVVDRCETAATAMERDLKMDFKGWNLYRLVPKNVVTT